MELADRLSSAGGVVPFSGQWDGTHSRDAHLFKAGALVERYQGNMFNPTFSLGISMLRSGSPQTVFVQANRSRSQWLPSLAPGVGQDRPSYASGYGPHNAVLGRPEQWFDPAAFTLQEAGTFGNTGRGDFFGPNLRAVDLAFVKPGHRGDAPSETRGAAGCLRARTRQPRPP